MEAHGYNRPQSAVFNSMVLTVGVRLSFPTCNKGTWRGKVHMWLCVLLGVWLDDRSSPRSSTGSVGASTMTTSSSTRDSGDELKSLSRPASESVLLPSLMRITPAASRANLGTLAPRPRGRPAGKLWVTLGGGGSCRSR